jgi:hypothetical protein
VFDLGVRISFIALANVSLAPQTKDEKYGMIYACKAATELEDLCSGLPSQFVDYIRYTRSLGFEEVPVKKRKNMQLIRHCMPNGFCCSLELRIVTGNVPRTGAFQWMCMGR